MAHLGLTLGWKVIFARALPVLPPQLVWFLMAMFSPKNMDGTNLIGENISFIDFKYIVLLVSDWMILDMFIDIHRYSMICSYGKSKTLKYWKPCKPITLMTKAN